MKLRFHQLLSVITLATLVSTAVAKDADYLNIGDPAPKLSPAKWVKGEPIESFGSDYIYIVEFWATWCGPCKDNIPHLTEIAAKYKDEVKVIGVDIWEAPGDTNMDYMKKVEKFVESQGDNMNYIVAIDGPDNQIANDWMRSAYLKGIPASFIINKEGTIAWLGHPSELDKVLPEVLAGTFDIQAARKKRSIEVELIAPIEEAMKSQDYEKAIEVMDAAEAKRPQLRQFYMYYRLNAWFHMDLEKTKELCESVLEESGHAIGVYSMMCSILATEKDLSPDAYLYGVNLVDQAIAQDENRRYLFYAMKSQIYTNMGNHTGAIEAQEQAVKLAEKSPYAPEEYVKSLRDKLAELKAE